MNGCTFSVYISNKTNEFKLFYGGLVTPNYNIFHKVLNCLVMDWNIKKEKKSENLGGRCLDSRSHVS
jgi:hypothetical protein